MRAWTYTTPFAFLSSTWTSLTLLTSCYAAPSLSPRNENPLVIDRDPAPAPEDSHPGAAGALGESAYLPAQIGGIVGSYAVSLIIVALLLLLLAKRRRERLTAIEEEEKEIPFELPLPPPPPEAETTRPSPVASLNSPQSPIKNFSYPTPLDEKDPTPYIFPSPQSERSTIALGVNPLVDQSVVAADREMAQQQLEEMYKYVMEQEAAKEAGIVLDAPVSPVHASSSRHSGEKASLLKKSRNKPANLDLSPRPGSERTQSRTSSILSALKSPRKKTPMKGISISSPIMTPMSATFPRQDGEEMETIPPRHYAPAAPPPIPHDQDPYAPRKKTVSLTPITPPDISPESTMSIDERLEAQLRGRSHSRNPSQAPTEADPWSAISDSSVTPLVGLPSSPKPGATFNRDTLPSSPKPGATFNRDTLPSSPKPGATFTRPNPPSAIRTGGNLPLRAYEPSLYSPSSQATKQTVFERAPLSPGAPRTPWTGAPVPYSPYQPFTPVVPMTPSLVTKADRKRMRAMQPKTPTTEMVRSSDDVW